MVFDIGDSVTYTVAQKPYRETFNIDSHIEGSLWRVSWNAMVVAPAIKPFRDLIFKALNECLT